LLGYGREGGVEYVCMTRVLGVSLRRADLTPSQREAVLRELGATLHRIHNLPKGPFADSGLFPQDPPGPPLNAPLEALFARIVEAMNELPDHARLHLPAEHIAAKAIAALPETTERVALHSNPAGEHAFADPQAGALTGLIDFGDAYIGHPAFDLRPWRDHVDRTAVLAGYAAEGAVDDSFLATWRVALILGELAGVLRRREPPARAEENLRQLLRELETGEVYL
jgi:aminoglycoside phosphotransferase (APT) family kinase protein